MINGKNYWNAEFALSADAIKKYDVKELLCPYESEKTDLTIYVSCYNESKYIVQTLEDICSVANDVGLTFEIFVVDDNSSDNSVELVTEFIANHPQETIILRSNLQNKGLAQNYFDVANLSRGKYYRLMCGDNAETIESIIRIFRSIGNADIIIPYYIDVQGKGVVRKTLSSLYTWMMNKFSGNKLKYYNGLAVHHRKNIVRWSSYTRGFGFQAYLLCELINLGFSYQEIGLLAIERRTGRSNALTLANVMSITNTLMQIGIRRISNKFYKYNK